MPQPSFSAGKDLDELMAQLGAIRQQTGVPNMPTGQPMQQAPQAAPMQQAPQGGGYDMAQARQSLMPTPRSEMELAAIRGQDALKATQMGKQMYDANNPKGRGVLGAVQHGIRSFSRDDKTQGYTDQATDSLAQARAAQVEEENRLATDRINGVLQGQGVDLYKQGVTEAGSEARNIRTTDTSRDNSIRTTDASQANNAATIAAAQTARDDTQQAAQYGKSTPWHDGDGGVVNVYSDRDTGQTFTVGTDGNKEFIDTRNLTPYSSGTTASTPLRSQLAKNKDTREQQMLANRDEYQTSRMSRIMNYDNLRGATGRWDASRMLSSDFKLPLSEQQEKDQAMGITMAAAKTEALAPILSIMGVNPTDRDMELAMSTVPSADDQPMAWFDYVEFEFAPAARNTAMRMIREGTSELTYDEIMDTFENLVNDAQTNRRRIYGQSEQDLGDFDVTQPITVDATDEQMDARLAELQRLSKGAP